MHCDATFIRGMSQTGVTHDLDIGGRLLEQSQGGPGSPGYSFSDQSIMTNAEPVFEHSFPNDGNLLMLRLGTQRVDRQKVFPKFSIKDWCLYIYIYF